MGTKKFYQSKTIWVNVVATVAFFVQQQFGFVLDPIIQAQLLTMVNVFLRFITKTELK